jgi:hypothetical protein
MASMGNAQRGALGGLAKLGEGARTTSDLSRVGGGLSRGANEGKKLNAAPWSDTWPAAGATLDLDFANNRGFVRGVGQGGVMDAITFTRASNGTFVKPDGTLSTHANQGALGNNLLNFPQDFDNAAWNKTRVTIEQKAILAPNNFSFAQKVVEDTSVNTTHLIRQAATLNVLEYTFSIYAQQAGRNWVRISNANLAGASAFFDLSIGVLGLVGSGCTAFIENVGNGWYRCSITFTPSSGTNNFDVNLGEADNDVVFTGDGESGIFIWGAQLEVGSTATEYFPTNIGEPRFDWASTEQVAQRNLLLNSSYPENWTTINCSLSTNTLDTTDPNGNNTAIKLTSSSSGVTLTRSNTTIINSEQKTVSVYLKAGNISSVQVGATNIGTTWSSKTLNLLDGTLSGSDVGSSVTTVEVLSNGWYRLIWTSTLNNQTSGTITIAIFTATSANETLYIWQPMINAGSTADNYQTTGAQIPATTPLRANPTSNGILIEEARTNRLLWNRDATQTEWVKTNITAAKDQTGIDGVANAASSLTATDDNGTCIQTITLGAGNRTGSVYLKRLTGTGLIQVTLDGSTYSTVELSDTEWYRIVLSGSVTNPTVGIKIAVDGDAVAMDYGQVEDGLSVSTPILTTTSTATRAVDSATRFIDDGLNVNGMTAYAEFVTTGLLQTTTNSIVVGFGSAVNNNPQASVISYRNDNFATGHNPRNIDASIGVKNTVSVTFAFASGNSYYIFEGATNGETPSDLRAGLNSSNLIVAPLNKIGIGNPGRGTGNISTIGTMTISRVALFTKQSNTNTLQELTK